MKIIFCTSDSIVAVPCDGQPEDFAGFCDDELRVYIPANAVFDTKVKEVLSAYPDVRLLREKVGI